MLMDELALIIKPGTYVIYNDRNGNVMYICNEFDYDECFYKIFNVIDISVGSNFSLVITLDITRK